MIKFVGVCTVMSIVLGEFFQDSDSATALEKRAGIEILLNNLQFKKHSISTDDLAIFLYGFCLIGANYSILTRHSTSLPC